MIKISHNLFIQFNPQKAHNTSIVHLYIPSASTIPRINQNIKKMFTKHLNIQEQMNIDIYKL